MERRKLTNKIPKYNKDAGPNDKHKKLNIKDILLPITLLSVIKTNKSGESSIKQNNHENKKRKQDLNKIKPKNKSNDLQHLFSIKNHQDKIEEPKNLGLKQLFSDNNIKKPLSFNFQTYLNKKVWNIKRKKIMKFYRN